MADEATDDTTGAGAATDVATGEVEGAPAEVRSRLALALDVDDIIPALRLARELSPWFATMKVGLELYSATGPEARSPRRRTSRFSSGEFIRSNRITRR